MGLPRPQQHIPIRFSRGLIFFGCYFLAAKLGLMLATINQHVSPLWPASGVATAGLLILGRRYWPFIWAAALVANSFLGTPFWTILIMSAGNTLEALISEFCFRHLNDRTKNETPLVAGLTASLFFSVPFAALIGSLALAASPWGAEPSFVFSKNFFTWWTGDTIGLLLVVPLALRAWARDYSSTNWKKGLATLAYFLVVGAFGYLTIWAAPEMTATLMFLFPLLLAGVWFFGGVETALSLWVLAFLSVIATLRTHGPFYNADFNTNLIQLQLFVGGLAGTEIALRFFKRSSRPSRSLIVTLLVGWLVTGIVFHSFNRKESEIDQARFNKLVSDANAKIAERLLLHETVLRSAAGFLRSLKEFDDLKWRTFVSELDLQKFTGLYGLGYTVAVPSAQLDDWIKARKKKIGEKFIFSQFDSPGMKRTPLPVDEHFIVVGFEPRRHLSDRPLTIDMTFEAIRHKTFLESRESGAIRISERVPIQNMSETTGYMIVAPVYRTGNYKTSEEQRANFIGWIHSPVLMSEFLEGVFGSELPEVAMIAQFGGAGHDHRTLFPTALKLSDLNRRHEIFTELQVWGKTFRMEWHRTNDFSSRKDATASWLHFIGVLITALAAALVLMYENQFRQAQRLADQRTREVQMRDRLWTSLTRVVPAGIFQLDLNGKLTFTNERWREYTKLDLSTNPNACWISALDPTDHEAVRSLWEDLRHKRIDSMQVQCRVPASSKTFAMSLRSVQDDDGNISHFIGTLHDITEIHARQMQTMHSSRMASIGVMAAGMAHEINNPLAIIAGRTQLMMRHLDSQGETPRKALKESADIIKQTVDRIARIVRGLRVFSRGGETDSFLVASVPDIVQSTAEFCSERFKKGGVELRVKPVPSIELGCREVQVSQVLLNLINNGYDAVVGLEEKWVEIEVQETHEEVLFCVTDSGGGISSEIAEKIMIPFFTTKPIGQGTGLGLSISKGIAQDHCGDLVLDSKSSRTRFVFSVSKRLLEDGTVLAAL